MDIAKLTDTQKVKEQRMDRAGGPQQQRINVDLRDAQDIFCVRCNNPYFMEGLRLKKLSVIVSPTGKEELIPMQTLLCMNCGLEYGQNPPDEDNIQ